MDDSIVGIQRRGYDGGGAEIKHGNIMRGSLIEWVINDDLSVALFSRAISVG